MATLRLTDITLAQSTAITPTTLVHIVTTGDTSQNGAGSSYKAKLSQIYDGLSGYCMPQLLTTFVIPCSPLGISPNDEGDIYFGSTSGLTVDVANSRVGIGTSTPSYKLHVSGSTFIDGALSATGATSTFRNDAPNSVTSEFYIGSSGSVKFFNANNASKYIAINENGIVGANIGNGANSFTIFGASSEVAINAESGAPVYLQNGVQFSTGNVIIGSLVNPGYKLFVSGNTLVTGRTVTENFTMTSGATNGYVLKSDASGNASWQPSSLTTKEVFYKSVSPNSTFGNNATIFDFYLNGGTDPVWVNGIIPSDFSSLISSDLIVLPEFTTTIESYSEIRHSQPGQIFSSSTLFYSAMTSYVEGQNQTIDVSPIFSAVTANDIFSYNFFENNGNNLFVYGLRFKYNAV